MESATIAANGFRLRVPYGTLLCVSDKVIGIFPRKKSFVVCNACDGGMRLQPLHGEVKLKGMADAFYDERVAQHLQVGLEFVRILR